MVASEVQELLDVLDAVREGDFSARLSLDGDASTHAKKVAERLNAIVHKNEQLTHELQRVSRVVGKKGQISQRAVLPGVHGGWQVSVEAVNDLVEAQAEE